MGSQLTVRLSDDLSLQLSRLAERLKLRRSDVIRMALERLVEELGPPRDKRPYERVRHLVGSVSSGIPDLGSDHRRHLIQRFKRDA